LKKHEPQQQINAPTAYNYSLFFFEVKSQQEQQSHFFLHYQKKKIIRIGNMLQKNILIIKANKHYPKHCQYILFPQFGNYWLIGNYFLLLYKEKK